MKRNEAVAEKAFENRLEILSALNDDFQKNFGTKDTQSYADTYAGSLRFMNSKISMPLSCEMKIRQLQNCMTRVNSVAVVCWRLGLLSEESDLSK